MVQAADPSQPGGATETELAGPATTRWRPRTSPAGTTRAGTSPAVPLTRTGQAWTALAWVGGTGVACLALFACYLRQSGTVAVGSDGASQALQAWDLVHGNPLLRGWWVTDVSFYTTELPQYALIELARGLNADVIHVAGALTYTLLVLAAALLARGRAAGPAGPAARARALLVVAIMLAPPLGAGTQTLLLSPDHTGTCVPVLLVFLLIDWRLTDGRWPGRPLPGARWCIPVLVWLGLTWAAVADAMTIFIAVVPLALICAVRLVTPGHAPDRLAPDRLAPDRLAASGQRGDVTAPLLVAALLVVPAELAVTALIRAHGGWQVNGLRTALAGAGRLPGNARLAGQGLLELFGADVFGASGWPATALATVHLAGAALAAAGVLAAATGFFRRGDLVEQLLLTGIMVDLAAYLSGVQAVNIASTREIVPVLPFAAVLAGRRLAGRPGTGRCLASRCLGVQLRPALCTVLALCPVLAVYAAGLGYAAAQPSAAPQHADLASWLRAHHLTAGLSGYHLANIVTLVSGGAVTLRPVTAGPGGRLTAYTWNASSAWFDPASQHATFLVLAAPGTPGSSGLTAARATATFGRPARTYHYRTYAILVWPRGANLLTSVAGTSPTSHRAPAEPAAPPPAEPATAPRVDCAIHPL